MERKIGEIFEYNGEWYQCVEVGQQCCSDCAFHKLDSICHSMKCSLIIRSDETSVIFKKLEKVGKPYEHYGKLYQCYKLPMETEIRLLPNNCYPIGKDNLVEIEIKQNKEDMEEKDESFYETSTRISNGFKEKLEEYFKESMGKVDTSMLKPFDLEAARSGKPVCTRGGAKARIICFDAKSDAQIIALITTDDGTEITFDYLSDGTFFNSENPDNDLMMLSEKKEGWVNVYKSQIHDTLESAEEGHKGTTDFIKTIRVEWEE